MCFNLPQSLAARNSAHTWVSESLKVRIRVTLQISILAQILSSVWFASPTVFKGC